MMTMTRITVCHLVTLLLSLWVKVSTSPWSPASASLLARALATVICLHIYITIYKTIYISTYLLSTHICPRDLTASRLR